MARSPRLSETLTWSWTPIPWWRSVLRAVPLLGGLILGLVTQSPLVGRLSDNPRVRGDKEVGALLLLEDSMSASPMPRGSGSVSLLPDRAVTIDALGRVNRLPAEQMRLIRCTRGGPRWSARKALDSVWTAEAMIGDRRLVLRGPWIAIGHLGSLCGWAEPE